MTNQDQGAAAGKPGLKRKIAERDYLAPDGSVVDDEEEATGVRYTQLATGKQINYQIPDASPGKIQTMIAVFGLKTWIGNLVSQFKGDLDAVVGRLNELAEGNWPGRAPGEGPVSKINLDALAEAMAMVAEELGKIKAGDSADQYKDRARAKLEEDPTLRRKFRADPQIGAKYNELVGKATSSVDALSEI